jgi:hypothetical protein
MEANPTPADTKNTPTKNSANYMKEIKRQNCLINIQIPEINDA